MAKGPLQNPRLLRLAPFRIVILDSRSHLAAKVYTYVRPIPRNVDLFVDFFHPSFAVPPSHLPVPRPLWFVESFPVIY